MNLLSVCQDLKLGNFISIEVLVREIWSRCLPDLYLIEQECQGEESHQSLDCLGEGPEDFQQMILLYRDYIRLYKIETEYSSIPAFCKSRFRLYGVYIEDEVILFNTVKEILLSLTLICCNVKWYYIFTIIQRKFKILNSFYIPAAWIWG